MDGVLSSGQTGISISASSVTFDLQEFEINSDHSGVLLQISGSSVRVKNGVLRNSSAVPTVQGTGEAIILENMDVSSGAGSSISLSGDNGIVRDSRLGARSGVSLSGIGARIERNVVSLSAGTGIFTGDNSAVIDNAVTGGALVDALIVLGSESYVGDNRISATDAIVGILINGNDNTVADNLITGVFQIDTAISVLGEANVIDGNILRLSPGGNANNTGIAFQIDGNFFGNNRMAATVPFDLGGTAQTDWGSNAGF